MDVTRIGEGDQDGDVSEADHGSDAFPFPELVQQFIGDYGRVPRDPAEPGQAELINFEVGFVGLPCGNPGRIKALFQGHHDDFSQRDALLGGTGLGLEVERVREIDRSLHFDKYGRTPVIQIT